MADVRIIELTNSTGFPRRYAVSESVAIDKLQLLQLTDPRTASAPSASGQPCAGVSYMDKEADDDSTSITTYTDCVIDVVASGAITAGAPIQMAGADNKIELAPTTASGAVVIGYLLETSTDGETVNARIKL